MVSCLNHIYLGLFLTKNNGFKTILKITWVTEALNRPQKGPNMMLNGKFSQIYSQYPVRVQTLGGTVYSLFQINFRKDKNPHHNQCKYHVQDATVPKGQTNIIPTMLGWYCTVCQNYVQFELTLSSLVCEFETLIPAISILIKFLI